MPKPLNILQSASFYDVVAGNYNNHMTEMDNKIRERVRNEFKNKVARDSLVLDFGGGTGLDLPWLIDRYHILFLEPSVNMRSVAKKIPNANNKITYIEQQTDFNNWDNTNLPFNEKVNGILMNFAVLNCIKNIGILLIN